MFEAIRAALTGDRLRKYPKPFGDTFRHAASAVLGVNPDSILIGNGSDDLLTILTRAFVPEGGDPTAAVARFYQAVAAHDFGAAAALWTARMQAHFPPAEYIDHRFAATDQIALRAEKLLGAGDGVAVVYVDVIESMDGQTRRWVGTWQLVDTTSGWLLNRPNLRAG